MKFILWSFVLAMPMASPAWGAVGCDLNDPDRDVARLFPNSTGYKTTYVSIQNQGGESLLRRIETRLGDKFHGLYETVDVPYTLYEVVAGKTTVGYVHGVNEKGQYGGIQVFLALDVQGAIKAFYVQKITSRTAAKMRASTFGEQFVGLTGRDFDHYDVHAATASGKVAAIANPSAEATIDFTAVMRATKKNLILMDEFVYAKARLSPQPGAAQ